MGSVTGYSTLSRFEKAFSQRLIKHFSYLKGQVVTGLTSAEVDVRWVSADVIISNKYVFEVHYRWAKEDELYICEEIPEEDDMSMNEWFMDYVKGQVVKDIQIGAADRDDEAYLILVLESGETLDCRLGFCSETCEFYGLVSEILSEKEIAAFYEMEAIKWQMQRLKQIS